MRYRVMLCQQSCFDKSLGSRLRFRLRDGLRVRARVKARVRVSVRETFCIFIRTFFLLGIAIWAIAQL